MDENKTELFYFLADGIVKMQGQRQIAITKSAVLNANVQNVNN